MDRRDYIMRLIEQLGQILIALRHRILNESTTGEEVRGELETAARMGGLDLDLARVMTPDSLLMMVAPGGEVDPGRCWLLGELFYLEGLEAAVADRPSKARSALERAGFLYGMLQPIAGNLVGFTEAATRVEEIERRLAELPPPRRRSRRPGRVESMA